MVPECQTSGAVVLWAEVRVRIEGVISPEPAHASIQELHGHPVATALHWVFTGCGSALRFPRVLLKV